MKACVTGGAGFIGSKLVRRLQMDGVSTRLLTRNANNNGADDFFIADLSSAAADLTGLFNDVDVIFHCAGEIRDASKMRSLHVEGTKRLLRQAALHINATGKALHMVQLSSVGAYGPPRGRADLIREVTELTAENPAGEYEITKTQADHLVLQMAREQPLFTCTILRPSIVIGPGMTNQSVRSLVKVIQKKLFFYIGSRSAISTYIHVEDVVEALVLCGTDCRAKGQIFNLSNDCRLTEIVCAVARHAGIKPPVLCIPELPLRILVMLLAALNQPLLTRQRVDAMIKRTSYPNKKISDILNFAAKHAIPETVATLLDE